MTSPTPLYPPPLRESEKALLGGHPSLRGTKQSKLKASGVCQFSAQKMASQQEIILEMSKNEKLQYKY